MQDWTAEATKKVFFIADAPCHGNQYNDCRGGDNHPTGSPDGLTMEDLMKEFHQKDIDFTTLKLNNRFEKMIKVMQESHPGMEVQDLSRMAYGVSQADLDKAFKEGAVKSTLASLKEKYAKKNGEYYKKIDKEAKAVRSKMNIDLVKEQYKELDTVLGKCPVTDQSIGEMIDQTDCMSIGLIVRRPEAAIADPSRLIIDDIVPTYFSTKAFMDAANDKLEKDGQDAIGGFKQKKENTQNKPKPSSEEELKKFAEEEQAKADAFAELEEKQAEAFILQVKDDEKITGALPLYLGAEHWQMARRRMPPLFGLMSTLDQDGFTYD